MKIRIYDIVQGDTAVSYEDGKECLRQVMNVIDRENVILDFEKVGYVITAFLNPVIGDLILKKGQDIMKKIEIENANKNIIEKIKIVKTGALLKREDFQA